VNFRKEVNKGKEAKLFEKDLQEEFEELISEKREEYNRDMTDYELQYKAWKFQQTKKVFINFIKQNLTLNDYHDLS